MTAESLRRWVPVIALAVVPWTWALANFCYMLAIRSGGSDETGASTLALAAQHPTLLRVAVVSTMVGAVIVVPAILGFYRLAGDRLAVVVGGAMMAAGYVCYGMVNSSALQQVTMAEHGGPTQDFAAVIDASMMSLWGAWLFIVFALGNLIGTLVLAVGLWRAHVTPRWVPLAIACWPVLHVLGLIFTRNEVPQVVGAVVQAVGFGACAVLAAGRTRPQSASTSPRSYAAARSI